jgi:hypothetical protein
MARRKRSKRLEVAKKMPRLYHTLPDEGYAPEKSEVLEWLGEQHEMMEWLFEQLRKAGYVEYDPETGLWSGIEC